MPANPKIEIGRKDSSFVLTGDVDAVLGNQRLHFSLKRLGFERISEGLAIPFQAETEIRTLQDVQEILRKFGFEDDLSVEIRDDRENFIREQENFHKFSENARLIRNDAFRDNPSLIAAFGSFQDVIGRKLTRKLYPLQLLSAFHMTFAQNACNFAVPGAGKTAIVYAAYSYLKSLPNDDPRHVEKLVVIGPLSSFAPWEKEYLSCFGQKPQSKRLSGDHRMSRSEKEEHLFSGDPAELTLIFHGGVESLRSEIMAFLKSNKAMVVVDEAHRIKNPEGMWGKSIVEIGREARSRIILTGTPVPNGYEDLFNLFQFLYPFKYKDILRFHYGNLVEMTKSAEFDSARVKELTDNISPYFIRITKSDLKLPPVTDKVIAVTMGERQREIYDYVEAKYLRSFSQDASATIKDFLNKAKLIRLRQAATNPTLLLQSIQVSLENEDYESRIRTSAVLPDEFQDDSGILSKIASYAKAEIPQKFIAAKTLLSECLARGEKVIVWTIFIQNAKGLQLYLADQGIRSELLIGEVEQSDRESLIDAFNDPEVTSPQVLVANPFSVAESISLHKGCHNAIYLERDYNCSNFLQSKDRIHRVGLLPNQETNYFYLISKESIDGVINDRLEMKARRMEKIIDSEIPLFARINDSDETDLIKALMQDYAQRT
jgi:superfamily II DNA or RNA helicase